MSIRNFRGVGRPVSLRIDGKSLVLFGESGSGKSSFVDALERLLTSKVATLDGRGMGLSSERHGRHIRAGTDKPLIEVVFDDRAKTTVGLETDRLRVPVEVRNYLEAARDGLYILRRGQLLDFVESQPKRRYELLQPFIPLGAFKALEETLRQAREKCDKDAADADQALNRATEQLRRVVGIQPQTNSLSEADVVTALSAVLATVGQEPVAKLDAIRDALARIQAAVSSLGDLSRYDRISHGVSALEQLGESIKRPDVDTIVAALEALREREVREARVFYEAVLEQGAQWIEREARRACPLCEQDIDADAVVRRIRDRLSSVRGLVELRRAAMGSLEAAKRLAQAVGEEVVRSEPRLRALEEAEREGVNNALEEATSVAHELLTAVSADVPVVDLAALRAAKSRLQTASEAVTAASRTLRSKLGDAESSSAATQLLAARDVLNSCGRLWTDVQSWQAKATEARRCAEVARRLVDDAQMTRKLEFQALFDELSKDINDIYGRFHPEESHGGIRLDVRDIGQGSVNLRADFYDRADEDPRAYYSEGHLDTLGLSIFLALRRWQRKRTPDFNLLLLDDVLTSIDVEHALRVAELLLTDFGDYQILLVTHDRIWFEYLKDIQARCGVSQRFVNKAILRWTLEEGPEIQDPEDARTVIDRVLAERSAAEIAGAGGRLLEQLLQELRYALRLRVPAKRGERYEIGDLWPAFYSAVKREFPSLYASARDTMDALNTRWPIRNWIGGHWNTWAQNVSRKSASEFTEAIRDLFDSLFCRECRRFIEPSITPEGQLACRGGHLLYQASAGTGVEPSERTRLVKEARGSLRGSTFDTRKYLEWKRREARRER